MKKLFFNSNRARANKQAGFTLLLAALVASIVLSPNHFRFLSIVGQCYIASTEN